MSGITMKKIAEKAGVSQPAVSHVLNNRDSLVSRATRERVLRIARELNYRPNHFAKSLKTGKTGCIGLMGSLSVVDVSAYCLAKTTWGIETELGDTRSAYSLVMFGANFQGTSEKSRELIERRMVDGLIIMLMSTDMEKFKVELLPVLRDLDIPFVVIHATSKEQPYHNVGFDSVRCGRLMAEHLAERGYRDLGFYMRDRNNPQILEMLDGFRQGMASCRLAPDGLRLIERTTGDGRDMIDCRQTIRQLETPPRALYFPDEKDAHFAVTALAERGLRVPEDVAVAGCDDEMPAAYFVPTLTTIHHPFVEKGRAAVHMLTDILDGKSDRQTVQRVVLEPHLVVRKTT